MTKPDKYTHEEDTRFTLRINKNLFKQIQEDAYINKRSTAKHIAHILDNALNKRLKKNVGQ